MAEAQSEAKPLAGERVRLLDSANECWRSNIARTAESVERASSGDDPELAARDGSDRRGGRRTATVCRLGVDSRRSVPR
jgi:hypothetical protein